MAEEFSDQLSGGDFAAGVALLFAIVAIIFAWFMFWPVFILIWFNRDAVRQQINQWR
jgi:hypothetical protein